MATKYASASGNWSTMTWWTTSGGSTATTAPGAGDDADLNGKSVTLNQDVACAAIVGNGTLTVSGSRAITANIGSATSGFGISSLSYQSLTITGNVYAGNNSWRIQAGAGSTLAITGNVYGQSTRAVTVAHSTASCTINGNLYGSTTAGWVAMEADAGTVTINGNVIGGSVGNAIALFMDSPGASVTINGDVSNPGGGDNAHTISIKFGTVTVNGNVSGRASVAATTTYAIYGNSFANTINVNGTVTAGNIDQTTGGVQYVAAAIVVCKSSTLNLTGSLVDYSKASAVVIAGGTFNYTPTNQQTATLGGKTMYPMAGAVAPLHGGLLGGDVL